MGERGPLAWDVEEPPDASLLAELVQAVEAGRAPSQAALEEASLLAEQRRDVRYELRRQRALREVERVREANAGASERTIAKLAARRLGETAECVRAWVRGGVLVTHDVVEAPRMTVTTNKEGRE